MNKFPVLLLALALSASATGIQASESPQNQDVPKNPVQQQADLIRAELADGETYPHLTPTEHRRVLELLGRMEAQMGSVSSVDDLNKRAMVRLFNDQQEINAILTRTDDDSQLVCNRTRVVGSHRKQNVCITAAEWEERREIDKANMTRFRHNTTP